MRIKKLCLTLTVALVSVGIASPAVAGGNSTHRPMRIDQSFVPWTSPGPTEACGFGFEVDSTGSVLATHLGRSKTADVLCLFAEANFTHSGTLTAANGERLFSSGFGHTGAPNPDGSIPITITSTHSGGTGRFAHATGEATYNGLVFTTTTTTTTTAAAAGYSSGQVVGWISY